MMLTDWEKSFAATQSQNEADAKIGIESDMPEELKVAIRNMGPLTRRRFMKKLHLETLTEDQYKLYVQQFTK